MFFSISLRDMLRKNLTKQNEELKAYYDHFDSILNEDDQRRLRLFVGLVEERQATTSMIEMLRPFGTDEHLIETKDFLHD